MKTLATLTYSITNARWARFGAAPLIGASALLISLGAAAQYECASDADCAATEECTTIDVGILTPEVAAQFTQEELDFLATQPLCWPKQDTTQPTDSGGMGGNSAQTDQQVRDSIPGACKADSECESGKCNKFTPETIAAAGYTGEAAATLAEWGECATGSSSGTGASGMGTGASTGSCSADSDCPVPAKCYQNACTYVPCASSSACSTGYTCETLLTDGTAYCVPPEQACSSAADCPAGMNCYQTNGQPLLPVWKGVPNICLSEGMYAILSGTIVAIGATAASPDVAEPMSGSPASSASESGLLGNGAAPANGPGLLGGSGAGPMLANGEPDGDTTVAPPVSSSSDSPRPADDTEAQEQDSKEADTQDDETKSGEDARPLASNAGADDGGVARDDSNWRRRPADCSVYASPPRGARGSVLAYVAIAFGLILGARRKTPSRIQT